MTLCDVCNRLTERLLRLQKHGFIRVWMARPEEPFQTVLVATRHHVDVEMRDTLADPIVDRDERTFRSQSPFQRTGKELGNGKERREPGLWEIKQRRTVLFGNDQTVSGKERAAVQKRQRLLVLEYNLTFALTVDDLTEGAGGWRSGYHRKESCG